ncbi:iron-siderophore ABC transporter substrate-binding protein [Ancylobacter oerskovii]|nr:iron-siderophore ABC transporter substrate-binding protein [Ancylobacter oerskovii]MBS7541823.1 iron-siderophore ABC transporter substrate-binding protein [Ancylobacter oerskovii]
MSRRAALLGGLASLPLAPLATGPLAGAAAGGAPARLPRVVSMDFGLAETLIEIGVPPLALPNPGIWGDWVVEPALPPGLVNLGADLEPNLELLAALKPDLIVTTPYLAGVRPLLEACAPTHEISVYAPPVGHPYDRSVAGTRQLAAAVGRVAEGEALIARAEATLQAAGRAFAASGAKGRPVLIVQFLDTRHVRVYGPGGLFGDVIERTGLVNGWAQPGNYWGFSTMGIEALVGASASRLVYLEPIAPDTLDRLAASPLWNSLPFVRAGRVDRMPAALMFGMLPSAMRFARELARVLAGETAHG